jgi:uncharacterized protein YlxW (UPF0749 family)
MRTRSGRLMMASVLFLLGFLVVAQARSQATDQGLAALSVQDLTELVANVTTRNNELRSEIRSLDLQRDSLAATVERGDTSAVQIRADLNRIQGWSGELAVTGTGVSVTISGSVPGDAVELLLNELRNAGAEAIAINDIRVVAGVVASGAAGSVMAAGVQLRDPITVQAIGQSQTLAGSLTRAGGPIAQLAARYPEVAITVSAADRVTVPATARNLAPVLGRPRL